MQIHFRRDEYQPGIDDQPPGAFGVVDIPQALLERHGARILRPGDAVTLPGMPIRPTVYRWGFLLVPDDVLQNGAAVRVLNAALAGTGLELVPPGPLGPSPDDNERAVPGLGRLPRATEVRAAPGFGQPVVVDAWVALQTLRSAVTAVPPTAAAAAAPAPDEPTLRDIVPRISVDHLLMGSALMGAGPATEGSPDTSDPSQATFVRPEYGRMPVELVLPLGRRHRRDQLPVRRPVVAVLDTGVGPSPQLGVDAPPGTWDPDAFVTVDAELQQLIRQDLEDYQSASTSPVEVIKDYWEQPVTGGRLIDDLNSHIGHGTFIAGIVRQLAPDAQVRAIRVMYSDGLVSESALVLALTHLACRLRYAQQRADAGEPVDPADLVDVVNLSLGGYFETPLEESQDSPLLDAVNVLLDLGVIVVAAAGNDATTRRFYPAALAGRPHRPDAAPLVSVSALNPNGTKAAFANDGDWVNCWATGAAIVSTMPTWLRGDRTPDLRIAPYGQARTGRETLDIDDYSAGTGIWSGTSFATPVVAATIAADLLASSGCDGLSLDETSTAARLRRAAHAVAELPK